MEFNFMMMAVQRMLEPMGIASLLTGTLIGAIFGLLPGLGGILSMAVALPFSYGMDPMNAMLMFAGIMSAEGLGGALPAILINTPGTAQNAATCLDGYPMAKKGQAGRAIAIAAAACMAGSLGGSLVTIVLLPVVKPVIYSFGYQEFFWMCLFGLITIVVAAQGKMLKGLAGGGIGCLLASVGYHDMFGVMRWTGGSNYLWDGIPMVPFVTGLFAISELIIYTSKGGSTASLADLAGVKWVKQTFQGIMDVLSRPLATLRSVIIGAVVGIIPGLGGPVASFVSYTVAMRRSPDKADFGKGAPEGILVTEVAMNAKDGGALLPTVAFGIPGSPDNAILLGAFMIHGLQPGPLMIRDHMDIVYALLLGIILSQVFNSAVTLLISPIMAKISLIPSRIIAPFVLLLVFFGAYMAKANIHDVGVALLAGIFGYAMRRAGFPLITVVMGFILGPLVERAFLQTLQVADGSYLAFINRPISMALAALCVLTLAYPSFGKIKGWFGKSGRAVS
jgi:putative tricarboxylic transport membrane protein